jgi:adenylate kinase
MITSTSLLVSYIYYLGTCTRSNRTSGCAGHHYFEISRFPVLLMIGDMGQNIIVFLGPPGCGKGTQGAVLSEVLNIPVVSTGAILRAECESNTPLGKAVKPILARGDLVSDDLMNQVVASWIARNPNGFILDGYPRTVPQAMFLDDTLEALGMPKPTVIQIDVPHDILVERITGRRHCPSCGKIYHLRHSPPTRDGICDGDGTKLSRRADDVETVIRERLKCYEEATAPVIEYYRGMDFHSIDGSDNPAMVLEAIEGALGLPVW